MTTDGSWAWHVHHDVLVERLTGPIESRRDIIRRDKPPAEVERRLHLLRIVGRQDVLDSYEAAEQTAWEAFKAAERTALELYDATTRLTREAYEAAMRTAWEPVETLHQQECPNCPWNGETILPDEVPS